MRVLITRPEPSASQTAQKLLDANHEPILFPMSRRECVEITKKEDLHFASALIFTSANALRCFEAMTLISDAILNKPVYAVGEKTKQSTLRAGFKNVKIGAGDGEALAELITQDSSAGIISPNKDAPLVYLTTDKRTPNLEAKLAQSSLPVTPLIIYEMISEFSHTELKDILYNAKPNVVLFYSQSAVRRFFTAIAEYDRKLFTSMRYGCLSKEIASAIPDDFLNQIDIATEPKEHHLLACIGN